MCPKHLMKWNAPTRTVIAPKPQNVRGLLFLPSVRLWAVLFFERKGRVNVHDAGPRS